MISGRHINRTGDVIDTKLQRIVFDALSQTLSQHEIAQTDVGNEERHEFLLLEMTTIEDRV